MKTTSLLSLVLVLFFSSEMIAQENVFLSRDFWKTDPTVAQIKIAIAEGNDPAVLNKYAFDGVVYALLENTNTAAIKYLFSLDENTIEKRSHDSRTPVFWAAYKGNTVIMQYLLDRGAKVNVTDSHGNTPVTFAANSGQKNKEVYELFEKHGVSLVNEKNEDGVHTLFLIAPYLETENELDYFIKKGFNLKELDPSGNTIFNHAAKNGNIDFLKTLIEKGIDPKVVNKNGENAMLFASQGTRNHQNSLDTYKFLDSLGVSANVVGNKGRNPLHTIAYKSDDIAIYNYFIKKGVDVNLPDNAGDTPFMNAAKTNELKVVQFLERYVTDINLKNKNGLSTLAMALNKHSVAVVNFLINQGADIFTQDKKGNTLAYYLLNTFTTDDSSDFDAKLKLLQTKGLSLNQKQAGGNTLLHIAAQKNNLALLKRVTSFGINVNAKNDEGYTALHIAAMKAADDAVLKFLISQGADKMIKTTFEETAYDLASENEQLSQRQLVFLK